MAPQSSCPESSRGRACDVRKGLSWPLLAELTDTALEAQLFTAVGTKKAIVGIASPTGPRFIAS
jgi:hypothetical protein